MKRLYKLILSSFILLIAVNHPLIAQVTAVFTVNYPPPPVCNPSVISFTNTSTGSNGPLTYQWNFGVNAGVNSTIKNPSTTYASCGTFTVTLTVINQIGQSNTVTHQVTISCSPNVNFTVTPTAGCVPLNVQFSNASTAGSGSITGYTWDFGDGSTSSATNPPHSYTNVGCKSVTLTVTNSAGCTNDTTMHNLICPTNQPTAAFTANQTLFCAPPALINFTFNGFGGTPPYTHNWNFPGGNPSSSTQQNPNVVYNASGNYNVTLTITDANGCTNTLTKSNYINVYNYTTNFTMTATSGCAPFTVGCASTTNGATYSWTTNPAGNPATSTLQNPNFTFNSPGSYQICLTTTFANGCTANKCTTLVVSNAPNAAFTVTGAVPTCAPPLMVHYNNTSNGSGLVQYQWGFPGGSPASFTGQNPPNITYNTCGTFGATLIVTNSSGCKDTFVNNSTVTIDCPIACFTVSPASGCVGSSFSFDPSCSGGSPTQFSWQFGDGGTSNQHFPTHTYNTVGCYNVTLTIQNALGCSNTVTINSAVCVGIAPNANFSWTPSSACASSPVSFLNSTTGTTGYTTYQWDFIDLPFNTMSTNTNPNYTYGDTGWMDVSLVACNYGCCDTQTYLNAVYLNPPVANISFVKNCGNPFSVTLDGTGSIGADTYSWSIPGGNPSASTNSSVIVNYPSAGTYSVTLTVTNTASGCSYTKTKSVTVVNLVADFSGTPTSGCASLNVCFTNLTQSGSTYSWNIFDSNGLSVFTSTQAAPCFTFTIPGNYDVRLIATDVNSCKDTMRKNQYIHVYGPIINFAAAPSTGCGPLSVNFTDQTTDPFGAATSWQWNFGDAASGVLNTSILQNPSHTYLDNGTYDVTLIVNDNLGCADTFVVVQAVSVEKPTSDFDILDSAICLGTSACFFNTSSGLNPVTFSWKFGDGLTSVQSNPCHNYASAGAYNVQLIATDQQGCRDTMIKTMSILHPLADFAADTTATTCPPLSVQFTDQSASTGTGATYYWDFGDGQNSTLQNPFHIYTTAGSYDVMLIVTDAEGCSDTVTFFSYIQISGPSGTAIVTPSSGCAPLDVVFQVNATGTSSYTWDFGDGNVLAFSNLDSLSYTYSNIGTYYPQVILHDGLGCSFALTLSTVQTDNPVASFTATPSTFCQSGSVQFAESITSSFTITGINWNFGDPASGAFNTFTGSNPTHLYSSPGTYYVTLHITSQNGCFTDVYDTITVNAPPTANAGPDASFCINGNTQLNASGGLTYSWLPAMGLNATNVSNPIANPLTTTTYTVTVTDANGCTGTDATIITVNPLPNASAGPDAAYCIGGSTNLNASGGVSYSWLPATGLSSTNISNPTANPSATTTYTVTVTDANGCMNTDSMAVNVNALPLVDAGLNTNLCLNSSTTLNASGAVSYHWSPSTALSNVNLANPAANPPSTITYTVTGIDANGCINTDNVTITVLALPNANAGADAAICQNANTQLNASGGVSYSWLPATGLSATNISNPIANPSATTTYTVTVTDVNGCMNTDATLITVNALPNANAGPDATYCIGGSTNLNASGGVSCTWNPANNLSNANISNPTANPPSTTTYTVIVTDVNGCQNADAMVVNVNPLPTVDAGLNSNICLNSNTTLDATGATTYSWSPSTGLSATNISNPIANPSATTTYTVMGTDANGCSNTDNVTVTVLPLPIANAGPDANMCSMNSTQLQASGGVNYSWSPAAGLSATNISNPVASPTSTTIYSVLVTDASGCSSSDNMLVNVLSQPAASAGPDTHFCVGGSTQLGASGGVSYSWTPNFFISNTNISDPVVNPPFTSTYYVLVTGVNGCTRSDTVNVTVDALPNINAGPDVNMCGGSNTLLNAAGGVSYLWSPSYALSNTAIANPVANPTVSTTYFVTGTDANGCVNTDTITVNVISAPAANAGPDVAICSGDSSQLSGAGGVTYSWSPATGLSDPNIASPQVFTSSTTTYTLTVTDAFNCTATDQLVVTVNALPVISAGPDATMCAGVPLQLGATGGTTYVWSPSTYLNNNTVANPIANPPADQSYEVDGTDANGCKASDTLNITVMQPFIAAYAPDTNVCEGASVQLYAAGSTYFSWSPSSGLSATDIPNPIANPSATTTYTVVVSDGLCFSQIGNITVNVHPIPVVDAGADQVINAGESVQLDATAIDDATSGTYSWSPTDGLSCNDCPDPTASPAADITYYVDYENEYGCRKRDSVYIVVLCNGDVIYVPNAFTPNGDGLNDVFRIKSHGLAEIKSFKVYDRWGQMVFQSTIIDEGWDGNYQGKPLPSGVYVYYLETTCTNGGVIFKKGNVTLLR